MGIERSILSYSVIILAYREIGKQKGFKELLLSCLNHSPYLEGRKVPFVVVDNSLIGDNSIFGDVDCSFLLLRLLALLQRPGMSYGMSLQLRSSLCLRWTKLFQLLHLHFNPM